MVTFTRHRDLARNRMVDTLHGVKRVAARLVRFDGAYLRFSGEIRVEHYRGAPRSSISTPPTTRSGSSCTSATPAHDD